MKKLTTAVEEKRIRKLIEDELWTGGVLPDGEIIRLTRMWTEELTTPEARVREEIALESFKKGYIKGVMDSEYGQTTSEELLGQTSQKKTK